MSKLWEKRKAPTPLDWAESIENHTIPTVSDNAAPTATSADTGAKTSSSEDSAKESNENKFASLRLWTVSECCQIFSQSVKALRTKLEEQTESENPILYWDKDDEDAMNFVAAAANLRCFIFSINIKSKFEIKCKRLFLRYWQ